MNRHQERDDCANADSLGLAPTLTVHLDLAGEIAERRFTCKRSARVAIRPGRTELLLYALQRT